MVRIERNVHNIGILRGILKPRMRAECLSLLTLRTIRVVRYLLSAKNHELGYFIIINNSVVELNYNLSRLSRLDTLDPDLYGSGSFCAPGSIIHETDLKKGLLRIMRMWTR